MICRNKERGEAALSKIQSTTGNQNVHLEVFCASFSIKCSFVSSFSFTSLFLCKVLFKGITTSVNPNMLYSMRLYDYQ
jgi:hypothetical protein